MLPDMLVNIGGGILSYVEWLKNRQRKKIDTAKLLLSLKQIDGSIFDVHGEKLSEKDAL